MARVIVVDDDPDIAELVGLRMKLDGHQVDIEHDGRAGLTRVLASPPDVLIVDWTLPGLTGRELCEQFRAEVPAATTWIVMLTARPLTEDERDGICADELIGKPFSPRMLSRQVRAALQREQ